MRFRLGRFLQNEQRKKIPDFQTSTVFGKQYLQTSLLLMASAAQHYYSLPPTFYFHHMLDDLTYYLFVSNP